MEYSAYPISQRYLDYETRMRKLAQRLQWLRRHFLLVLLALCALIAGISFLLAQIGTFTSELQCSDCVYGEKQIVSCRAFLAKPTYEYATADGAWSKVFPDMPGSYRIRGVTRDGFGRYRYTSEQKFVLAPRPIVADFSSESYIYGEMSLQWLLRQLRCDGLADGDILADATLELVTDAGNHYTAIIHSLRIENADGRDVTASYRINRYDGNFSMKCRPITITTADTEKLYDGLAWSEESWQLDGSLAPGDRLSCSNASLPAQAGQYEINVDAAVLNAEGEDVTAYYDITFHIGTLTVLPRPMTISTGSASRVYNGKELTENSWEFVSGDILDGHRLQVQVTGSLRTVGNISNTATVQLLDGQGSDVTENYDITIQCGNLEILPIELVVHTDSAEKIYDGWTIAADGKLISGQPLNGHSLKITTTPCGPDAGTYQNSAVVTVCDSRGNDVTADGYRVTMELGTLQINRRPITFESGSDSKYYDGFPLKCEEFKRVSGTFASIGGNQSVTDVTFSGSQTAVGSSFNTFEVTISVPGMSSTTHNYDITYIYGTLTVLPSEQDPSTDQSSDSDGIALWIPDQSDDEDICIAIITGKRGFSSEQPLYLRQRSYGDYTTHGWQGAKSVQGFENDASPLLWLGESSYLYKDTDSSVHLKRLEGCPVVMPYFTVNSVGNAFSGGDDRYFGESPDELNITLYPFTDLASLLQDYRLRGSYSDLEYKYRPYAYEQYLDIPDSTREGLAIWAKNNGLSADSETLIEDIRIAVMCAGKYDINTPNYPEGEDHVLYFLNEARSGICQQFASAATLIYRLFGIPARYTVGYLSSAENGRDINVVSSDGHAWTEIYLDGIGWVPVDATPGDHSGGMEPLPAKASGYMARKIYDGRALDVSNIRSCVLEEGFLLYGHCIEAVYKPVDNLVSPGKYGLEIRSYRVLDEDGNDVSDLYDISFLPGQLIIETRPITITTASAQKSYDGLPLCCPQYWISQGSLAPGDYLDVELFARQTEPGETENVVSSARILRKVRGKAVDVTAYYNISWDIGSLTVT